MLEKMKEVGSQISTLASDAVGGASSTVRQGAESLAGAASAAASSFSEKSVRLAVEQMRAMLQIAAEELQKKPILNRPAKISASVDIGFTALEIEILMNGETLPEVAAPAQETIAACQEGANR